MTPERCRAHADIIETLRLILIQEGDDTAVLNEARIALSDWFVYGSQRPRRDHLHLIEGKGRRPKGARRAPLLSPVEDAP